MTIHRNQGSYRDPFGSVFEINNRIFRGIKAEKKAGALNFLTSCFYKKNAGTKIVSTRVITTNEILQAGIGIETANAYALWVEHQPIDFITYPYEWGFEFLKLAAIFQLDLQIDAITHGYQIKDSSAYNIQFVGCKPIFIDTLSFEPYLEGSKWVGYKQFCEQFLAPLAVNSFTKIEFNSWLRGSVDGLDIIAASRVLPLRSYLNPVILGHIHAQAWAMSKIASTTSSREAKRKEGSLPKRNLLLLLDSLRRFISQLRPHNQTYWNDYEIHNSYSDETTQQKENVVSSFIQEHEIKTLVDAGCNTGYFSEVALKAGATRVIGMDIDGGAISLAAKRPFLADKEFTPIQYDLTNPSPSLGWRLTERSSLEKRLPKVDGIICLALIHHLVIGKNIPLTEFIDWVLNVAPNGIVEFVPKEDPMVQGLLANRDDIFSNYREDFFLEYLCTRAEVLKITPLSGSSRKLILFKRTQRN